MSVGVPYEYYEANLRGNNTKENKPNLRDKGNCWFIPYETINSKDLKGKHPATFPVKLVEQCILFSGIKNGTILDPFMGSGSSAVGAIKQNFNYVGFDIDQDYIDFAESRILDTKNNI